MVPGSAFRLVITRQHRLQVVILFTLTCCACCCSPLGQPSPYVRAAFSTASVHEMDVALQRFADLLRAQGASKSKL